VTFTESLLDTDILSSIMRQNPVVIPRARKYLSEYGQFTLSIITRYEILRGLKAKGTSQQITALDRLCAKSTILPLAEESVVAAADIYADLSRRGRLIPDGDILIAATALVRGLTIVTNNENHFKRIRGLRVDNWLK
jgi:tRNA(fMet)-specific endonuclease VapC